MKKNLTALFLGAIAAMLVPSCGKQAKANDESAAADEPQYECIAYACPMDGALPPANTVTAINYLGANTNATADGIDVRNPERLHRIAALKNENPKLKVILSLGGANADDGWAEMTADDDKRARFIADALAKIEEFNLDGIDFDWEFPRNDEERNNYIRLFKEVREAVGPDKVVSAAAGYNGNGFDLKEAMKYLNYVCLMTYDMGDEAPFLHTSLHRSPRTGVRCVDESLDSCLNNGIELKDVVLGMAFYGRGDGGKNFKSWTDYRNIIPRDGMEERWDSIACVPYLVDSVGTLIISYENPRSLKIKCDYIKERGLRGGMYWRSECDAENQELTRTVGRELLGAE